MNGPNKLDLPYTRVERLTRDKHADLFVGYKEN